MAYEEFRIFPQYGDNRFNWQVVRRIDNRRKNRTVDRDDSSTHHGRQDY